MSRINAIQKAIQSLDGGEYQKLMDAYLYKKFGYSNIEPLGSHTGTNKVTKGIPDSYVQLDNGKYILIMYGTVESTSFEKIEKDIKSCFDKKKLDIEITQIQEITCCYTSTNIHIEQKQQLEKMIEGIKIRLIGIGTVSNDLLIKYPAIASEFLSIPIDTEQIYEIENFVEKYDKNQMNASVNMELLHRENEIESLISKIENNSIVMILGKSGIGKTRLALEVCRIYQRKHKTHKIYCIKNNGQMLYNDLKYYISDSGEYLIFIDDANQTTQLEHILDYIISPPSSINVKIILTVRDYAKDRIKKIIYNKIIPEEEEINVLSDENIKDILTNNLGIKNDVYLKQIAKIAKGNARLAILAGKIAVKHGFLAIHNSTDIFRHYYGIIIEKEFKDKNKIITAFIITLLGPFEYKNNEIAIKILRENLIEENDFYLLCHELNDSEIVDLYMNQAVKISDQSMGDYLLYYVLIEKKYITLVELLKDGFKFYKNKIIYALNTIITLFNTDECLKYINDQVNKVWNDIEDDSDQFEYVKCFHSLNEEKSLVYIKNKIDKMSTEDILLDNFNFKEKINNHSIKSELVPILGGFKYSDNYELALELITYYFKKRPSEIMDFYFLFTDILGYDINSFENEYEKELLNIKFLWKNSEEGNEINITILLLYVIENYIGTEFNITESDGERKLNLISFNLCMCDGLKKLRNQIWCVLGDLYFNERYTNTIVKILLNYNIHVKDQDQLKLIFKLDLEAIKKYIFSHIAYPNFMESKILYQFERLCKGLEITVDDILEKYKVNEEFSIYNTLVRTRDFGQDWESEQEEREENIYNMVKEFKEQEFIKLFRMCNDISEKVKNRNEWEVRQGISLLFNSIKENSTQYILAIRAYLQSDTPCSVWIRDKIIILISHVGVKNTEKIIFDYEYSQKNSWIYEFLFCVPMESVNIEYSKLLRSVFNEEIEKEQPLIPNIQFLVMYQTVDAYIVFDLATKILDKASDKPDIVSLFLGNYSQVDVYDKTFNIFKKHIDILENLYLIGYDDSKMDYKGELFIRLVNNDLEFFKRFTLNALKSNKGDSYREFLYRIWEHKDFEKLINMAFETIIDYREILFLGFGNSFLEKLFKDNEKDSELVKNRKIEWINNNINNNYSDIMRVELIFKLIASVFNYNKKEFILLFLKLNKNIETFRKIPLFYRFSWSGSEVPLIEREIEFIKELINSINGIDYLMHKAYLKDILVNKEKYKQNILVREYLDDMDLS